MSRVVSAHEALERDDVVPRPGAYVRLLRALSPSDAFVVGCLIDEKLTGRQLAVLAWEQVDLPHGRLRLPGGPRGVPISPLTAWALAQGTAVPVPERGLVLGRDDDLPWHPRTAIAAVMRRVAAARCETSAEVGALADLRRARAQERVPAEAAGSAWRARALEALDQFKRLDEGNESAHAYAFVAGTAGRLHGWSSTGAKRHLDQLEATRNPDGGFGLGRAYDPFSTGRENPPDTTYTVTLAGHVGRVLLEAHAAGALPLEQVDRIVSLIVEAPRVPVQHGLCVGYSLMETDATGCVNNVNALAGLFLEGARRAGSRAKGLTELLAGICQCHAAHYRADVASWAYTERAPALNDHNHDAASIEAALVLTPPIGRVAGPRFMRKRDYAKWSDPLGQVRLAQSFPSHQEALLEPFDAMLTDERADARLTAQLAYWAAQLAPAADPVAR